MVKCTKSIGVARKRCKGKKTKAKLKKCMKRAMCGPKKKTRRKKR